MSTLDFRSPMPVSAEELYNWHARPGAFLRLNPPWEKIEPESQEGTFGTTPYRVTMRTPIAGSFTGRFVSEAYDFRPGAGFQDKQIEGPFASWNHTHTMVPNGPTASFMHDHIDYQLPLGALGRLFGGRMVRNRLRAMFAYRHALTASDLRRHALYADRPRLKIVMTGSRGLIGSDLAHFLTTGGHTITRLVSGTTEHPKFDDGTRYASWLPGTKPDADILDGCDAVIHLGADSIADGRWTAAKRAKILASRTGPTRALAEAVAALPAGRRPRVMVSASAVGFYGDRADEVLTEGSSSGSGFLADVCRQWEAATEPASAVGVRVVHLRTGMVLSPKGGALAKQLPAFRAGGGAILGSGRQWISWISIQDAVGAIHHCLMTDSLNGPVNVVSPNPVTNRVFAKTLAGVLGRPALLRLPRPVLRVMFGDIADEVLLVSTRTIPQKLLGTGFGFDHAELASALRFVLGRM